MKWKSHKEKWINCKECDLCEVRNKVVLYKGKIPADILFLSDYPGESEDELGVPFIGKAGKFFISMMEDAGITNRVGYRVGYTYLNSCKPPKGEKPTAKQVRSCSERLIELIGMVKPEIIVCLGKSCEKNLRKFQLHDTVSNCRIRIVTHPGVTIRASDSQKGLLVQKTIIQLMDLKEELAPF